MYDKEKVIIMSKMAVYDKKNYEKDRKTDQYFRHDYIYKQNSRMRFFLFFGCFIIILFYVMYMIGVQKVDIFTVDLKTEFIKLVLFVLAVMFFYSFMGTIIYTREFEHAQKRIDEYFKLVSRLEQRNEAKHKQAEATLRYNGEALQEVDEDAYGTDIYD